MPSAADRRFFWSAALLTVAADIITKQLAERALSGGRTIDVIGDWIRFHLVYNRGAAFGLHVGDYSRWIFLVIAVVAVILLERFSRSSPAGDWFRQLALGLVAGGAFGNMLDRIRSGTGVIDFIDVGINALRWPTFNIADIAVSCGAIALALSLWREDVRRASAAPTTG